MMKALILCALVAAGCGGSSAARPAFPDTWDEDDPMAQNDGRLIDEDAEKKVSAPRPGPRPLTRADLTAVLDAGPGAFLSTVQVRAVASDGGFSGWEIVSLWPDDGVELHPGDVVTAVNGRKIERPEHLAELWESLRSSRALIVDYTRAGERRQLLVKIED
jgi:S1-C subfamily serine protease